ncbi:EutP/PduV family microcompartment system protein [Oenococcus oeni]
MKKAIFIGAIGCGKTTLIQKMNELKIQYNKTQTIEFYDNIIDTPGEYVEHRRMYSNLMTTAIEANVIVLLQSATDPRIVLPTGFSTMFTHKTIGVVTKTDIASEDEIKLVGKRLKETGVKKIFYISAIDGSNIKQLTNYLNDNQ